jgi:hypothetical protein
MSEALALIELWIEAHNGAVTALATMVIAAFTVVLAIATTRQGRQTAQALITTERAFVYLEQFNPDFSVVMGGPRRVTGLRI